MHVIPGMDAAAANEIAELMLGEPGAHEAAQSGEAQSGMDAILDAGGQK